MRAEHQFGIEHKLGANILVPDMHYPLALKICHHRELLQPSM